MRTERRRMTGRGRAAGATYIGVVLAVLACGSLAAPALAQVPDNRGPRLDPEDSVPPAYRDTLDERDRQRLDAAREAGETFIPVIQGPGVAPRRPRPPRRDRRLRGPRPHRRGPPTRATGSPSRPRRAHPAATNAPPATSGPRV